MNGLDRQKYTGCNDLVMVVLYPAVKPPAPCSCQPPGHSLVSRRASMKLGNPLISKRKTMIDRRQFLLGTAGLTLSAAGLSGCGGGGGSAVVNRPVSLTARKAVFDAVIQQRQSLEGK